MLKISVDWQQASLHVYSKQISVDTAETSF